MFRKAAIAFAIVLLALTTACSSHHTTTAVSAGNAASPGACPTSNTRAFAKTRFVADAALAAGAFKRYIYTPYQQGNFKKGSPHRIATMAKAVVAGLFVVNRLDAAKTNAEANPTLCKVLVAPIDKFKSSVENLVTKGKARNIDESDVTSSNGVLNDVHSAATGAGAGFTPQQNVTVPGA